MMRLPQEDVKTFAFTVYIAVVSYSPAAVVSAGDQCNCADSLSGPTNCYECSTRADNTQFCADPFNKTHANVSVCGGPCAKWVQRPANGATHIVRTCSSRLNHRLSISLVCMKESHPGNGQLCFCNRPLCNSATSFRNRIVLPQLINLPPLTAVYSPLLQLLAVAVTTSAALARITATTVVLLLVAVTLTVLCSTAA